MRCRNRLALQKGDAMKILIAQAVLAAALLAGAADASTSQPPGGDSSYRVSNLPSLSGTSSVGYSVNDRGWVAGRSNLPGNQSRHATLWRNGALTDLGTLGGPNANSAVLWPVKNLRGIVSGITQTSEPDPLHEKWSCGFFFPAATGTGYRCLGFRWQDGVMTPLPTLGGTHGFATGTNDRGETVGWAENTVHDSTCVLPQVLQFRAVVWGSKDGQIRELPPLPGDSVSAATALNDRGQVVGISGICDQAAGRFSAIHDVLWEHGKPIDIGDLGGVAWNTPMAINQRGDVVGFANASAADGGGFNPRAVLWIKGQGIRNLGTLPGDVNSQALGINKRRQVVGQSCDAADNCSAFLWENGVMMDLNELVAFGSDDVLTTANDIDDFGRITGQGFDAAAGQFVAFLATSVRK
jgi:probable HAF family extracellular repeat protein